MKLLRNIYENPHEFDLSSPLHQWVRKRGYRSVDKLQERLKKGNSRIVFASNDNVFR